MAKQHDAWLHRADEIQKFVAIRMGRQIEILDFTKSGDLASTRAQQKCLSIRGCFEAAPGSIRVRIADKENSLAFIADHAESQIMRGGVLAHHAGSNHKEPPARQPHLFGLTMVQHNQVKRFVQLQIGLLAMRAGGFQIIDFSEDTAQTADVDRLALEFAFAH